MTYLSKRRGRHVWRSIAFEKNVQAYTFGFLKTSLSRYNNQAHSGTNTTPNNVHTVDSIVQLRRKLIPERKQNPRYPNRSEWIVLKCLSVETATMRNGKQTKINWSKQTNNAKNRKYYLLCTKFPSTSQRNVWTKMARFVAPQQCIELWTNIGQMRLLL